MLPQTKVLVTGGTDEAAKDCDYVLHRLRDILFDFGIPEKIDLEAFMNNNYKFNVSIERFAYLTGRSLSAFKRDFEKIFNDTPSHWLVHRRLQESYFLIDKKNKRPSDIYLDLGFEDLSHFHLPLKSCLDSRLRSYPGRKRKHYKTLFWAYHRSRIFIFL